MTATARALADEFWEFRLDHHHFSNLRRGELSRLERWDDLSAHGIAETREASLGFAERARRVGAADADRTLSETVEAGALMDGAINVWWSELQAPSRQSGLLATLLPALHMQPLVTADHAERYLEKLRRFPAMIDQLTNRLEAGSAAGITPLTLHVTQTIDKLEELLGRPLSEDPFLTQAPPVQSSSVEADRWREELADAVDTHLRTGLTEFAVALRETTQPAGRSEDRAGLCHLPGGDDVYQAMVKGHTTLELGAVDIHELGLERIALLEEEYRVIAGPLLGTDEPAEIYRLLRDDQGFRYADPEELVADAVRCLDKATTAMAGWFDPLPEAPCMADPIDVGAMAYYYPPTADGTRPGRFFFNVADHSGWATFQIPGVTYHEGIPGHHLQIALAIENSDIHDLHRHLFLPAFGEGWGLYSERLADEMGLYQDDWERIGMLTADSLRAGRLVVDTGIHALGWSRSRAIRYLTDNSPMSLHEITEEVDRYIACPGQALSYMLGRIEIESLRRDAEERLGPDFDIKEFHRRVLGNGAVPLGTLRRRVMAWSAKRQGHSVRAPYIS